MQKSSDDENKGDGANNCALSVKAKTSTIKVLKLVNIMTSKSSMVHRISEGNPQDPHQLADTLAPSDLQVFVHKGVYRQLQSMLHGNILSSSLVNVLVV